jgi:hypothetical protein
MCGGLQYLNQQLLQRAQDAKVTLFSFRACGLGFLNDDGFDVAEVPMQIESLLGRLSFMFLQKRGCLSCTSFTSDAASAQVTLLLANNVII